MAHNTVVIQKARNLGFFLKKSQWLAFKNKDCAKAGGYSVQMKIR